MVVGGVPKGLEIKKGERDQEIEREREKKKENDQNRETNRDTKSERESRRERERAEKVHAPHVSVAQSPGRPVYVSIPSYNTHGPF